MVLRHFTFLCGISHALSPPAVFIYLSTRAKRLSRGFYLACRLGSTSKRSVFVRQSKCDYSYRVLFFGEVWLVFEIRREFSDRTFCNYIFKLCHIAIASISYSAENEILANMVAPLSLQPSEENFTLEWFYYFQLLSITKISIFISTTEVLRTDVTQWQSPIFSCVFMVIKLKSSRVINHDFLNFLET